MDSNKIKEILKLYDLDAPKKSLGQNFLMNDEVLKDIFSYGELSETDNVLEIGPGLGVLSNLLAPAVGKLVLVELDDKLFAFLQDQLFSFKNIDYINADVLRIKMEDIFGDEEYKVIANIPYNITSKLFRKFSDIPHKPELMVLLIQKEVGERITAEAGSMSVLATVLQFYYTVELKRLVPNTDFFPAPKVNSAVVKLKRRFDYEEEFAKLNTEQRRLWQIVKIGFSSKRKKLLNNLANGLHLPAEKFYPLWEELAWDRNKRAQEMSVGDWIELLKLML